MPEVPALPGSLSQPEARRAGLSEAVAGVFAEFETNLRRERQIEGIAKARARGLYKGRPPTIDRAAILALRAEGLSARAIAHRLGIGHTSVIRLTKGA